MKKKKEKKDPRRLSHLINYLIKLIKEDQTINWYKQSLYWSLLGNFKGFQWRIPSIWCQLNEYAQSFLDHSFKDLRSEAARLVTRDRFHSFSFLLISLFSISLSFDNEYLNGKCSRHPNTNLILNQLSKQLEEAMRIAEQTSLS